MNFAILHHEDFEQGTRLGYGREDVGQRGTGMALALGRYQVVGLVAADSFEDAYQKTQNDFAGPNGWGGRHVRSTSVGDVIVLLDKAALFAQQVRSLGFSPIEMMLGTQRRIERRVRALA